jgi:putative Mn2+ efflux pump MntP
MFLVAFFVALSLAVSMALSDVAMAQGVQASDLTGPVQNGVEAALTAGFVIAAAILVGFAIYKIVKRFA